MISIKLSWNILIMIKKTFSSRIFFAIVSDRRGSNRGPLRVAICLTATVSVSVSDSQFSFLSETSSLVRHSSPPANAFYPAADRG